MHRIKYNVCSLTSVPPSSSLVFYSAKVSFVEGVTMNSWLVTVLLLASAANSSGGQSATGGGVGKGEGQGCASWSVTNRTGSICH